MISKIRPKRIVASVAAGVVVALATPVPFTAAQTLDYEFFKTRVAPIFLKSRSKDHARCYVCHTGPGGVPYLEKLPPGSTFWTEEQLRRIFSNVSKFVVPGNPNASRIVMYPLAPEAGGMSDRGLHSGGRQFESQNDPDWKTFAEWARGAKAGP